MRISDWSSDVCSSDLPRTRRRLRACIRFVGPLRAMMEPFMRLIGGQRVRVEELIRGHVACAEALAGQGNGGGAAGAALWRSEERRVGKGWGSTCRFRWSPYH